MMINSLPLEPFYITMHKELTNQGFRWRYGREGEMIWNGNKWKKVELYYWHPERIFERERRKLG
jgi:hypothetical protein